MQRSNGSPFSVSVYREESLECEALIKSLCQASVEFESIVLDQRDLREDGRPYMYASIHSIRRSTNPALARHQLRVYHTYGSHDEGEYVTTVLKHSSGQFISSTLTVPPATDLRSKKSYRTQLCRTAIEGLLWITAEEDDDASPAESPSQTPQQSRNAAAARGKLQFSKTLAEVDAVMTRVKEFASTDRITKDAAEELAALAAQRIEAIKQVTTDDGLGAKTQGANRKPSRTANRNQSGDGAKQKPDEPAAK